MNARTAICCLLPLACLLAANPVAATDGDFDATWAGGGRITFSVNPTPDNPKGSYLAQIIRENNGNLLIGGAAFGTGIATWFLGERHPDGTPVATFGANDGSGFVTGCALSSALCFTGNLGLDAMALQADGRIVVLQDDSNVVRTLPAATALDTAGVAGGTGYALVYRQIFNDAGGYFLNSFSLAQTPLSQTLLVGVGYQQAASPNFDFGLLRLSSDLSVDASFNDMTYGGVQYSGGQDIAFNLIPNDPAIADAVLVDRDGGILIVGTTSTSTHYVLAAARLNSDGSPDATYGSAGNGTTTLDWALGALTSGPTNRSVRLDSAGRLLVAYSGSLTGHSEAGMLVARFLPSGSIDLTFGAYQIPPFCDSAFALAATEDSAGRVLVAGQCPSDSQVQFFVARLHGDDGTLDTTFGNSGFLVGNYAATSTFDDVRDIVIDAGGHPVIAGTSDATLTVAGMARLEYDLIFTNNFENAPRGRLPGQ